jgi:hypothetical protein
VAALYRAYFERRLFRDLLDRHDITRRLLQGGPGYNPLFCVPSEQEKAQLLAVVGDVRSPRVSAEKPVAVEWWRQGETDQLHLINYADEPQRVSVQLPVSAPVRVLSPDVDEVVTLEGGLEFWLDVYAVLLYPDG